MKPWWLRVMGAGAFLLFLGSGILAMWARGVVGRSDWFLLAGFGALMSVFLGGLWVLLSAGMFLVRQYGRRALVVSPPSSLARALHMCDVCGKLPPSLYCQTHRLWVCVGCIKDHTTAVTSACAFVPLERADARSASAAGIG